MTRGTVDIAGEALHLWWQGAIYWPRRQTLLIADPHFGKAATFRSSRLPIPSGSTNRTLERLDHVIAATAAARLVILGDFWHARAGRSGQLHEKISAWRLQNRQLDVDLVLGNHDRSSGQPLDEWRFAVHNHCLVDPPFLFCHFPIPNPAGYVLAGHLHPAAVLTGLGRQRLRLPCFWFGVSVGVLPAFGEFTGCANVSPRAGDRVFVIADNEVIETTHPLRA